MAVENWYERRSLRVSKFELGKLELVVVLHAVLAVFVVQETFAGEASVLTLTLTLTLTVGGASVCAIAAAVLT